VDAQGAISPVALLRRAGLVAGSKICIIMNEYFDYTNMID